MSMVYFFRAGEGAGKSETAVLFAKRNCLHAGQNKVV